MGELLDEYCENIFSLLMVTNQSLRFNKLHETLQSFGAKMSQPTLIEHLSHLRKKGFILKRKQGKQNISYQVNWEKFETLKEGITYKQTIDQNLKSKEVFESLSLDEQITTLVSISALDDLFYLKLFVLNILEPSKKPEHCFSYIFIHKLLDRYKLWLTDTCRESKEKSKKALELIQRAIDGFESDIFDKKPASNNNSNQN
jgi:DNA-binding HxlR family transcriptional regulator